MLGTIVNSVAILIGGILGILFGNALPEKMKNTVIQGIGLAVILIGLNMAIQTKNPLVVIASLVLGGVVGELIDIELQLKKFGEWLEKILSRGKQKGTSQKPL